MIGAVAIGRNEGERLKKCLASLAAIDGPIVYVDSGSTDGSVANAKVLGAEVVELSSDIPFTAARARNAGYRRLKTLRPDLEFVMFIDGDCELVREFQGAALGYFAEHPKAAVVCGRRRERRPELSLYNRLCDLEWATPIGEAEACGGDALMRVRAFDEAGGYRDDLIAGEEPEMCLRMRERGWSIWRIDCEMTLHDAAIAKYAQWWRRNLRAGHAFAEVSAIHRNSAKRIWRKETLRAVAWTAAFPVFSLLGAAVHPAFFAGIFVYPLQAVRLAPRMGTGSFGERLALASVFLSGRFAEAAGASQYWLGAATGARARLIEYKA